MLYNCIAIINNTPHLKFPFLFILVIKFVGKLNTIE